MKFTILLFLLFSQTTFSEELTVATFNTSLRHKISHKREIRFEELIKELKRLDSDIVCLQEIVHLKERKRIIKELGFRYHYQHYSGQKQAYYRWPVCSLGEIFDSEGPLYCRFKNCLKMRGDTLGQCLDDKCAISFERLRPKNPNCSQAQLSQQNVNIVMAFINLINPFRKVRRFSGPGRDGLLLLSKNELTNKEEVDYSEISTHRRRGAISAELEFNGKPLKIFCAHLTSNLDGISCHRMSSLSRMQPARQAPVIREHRRAGLAMPPHFPFTPVSLSLLERGEWSPHGTARLRNV